VTTATNWAQRFDYADLKAGWVVDVAFAAHTRLAQGMDRAPVIRVHAGYTVDPGELGPAIDAYPGAIWLIGSEPDCVWQDNVWPEEYARIYHDLYATIKHRDGSSRVAAGGIVQPTPLRLEYLDRVLAAYQARYGQRMPVDLWQIHNAILNEQQGSWGAEIPPGIDASQGVIRSIDDNDNLDLFVAQIWDFRQWMADHGYGGYPLVVSEYGILMPEEYGFDAARVNAFMSATFDRMESLADATLGDPSDGHRLVQRWAWFSLSVPAWDPITGSGFNGNLFDPETKALTAVGLHYASQTSTFPPLCTVDLAPARVRAHPPPADAPPAQTVTRTLQVRVVNAGTVGSDGFGVRLAYGGPVSGTEEQITVGLPAASTRWLTFTLAHLQPGLYSVRVEVDPTGQVEESLECNNVATTSLLAPVDLSWLPVVASGGGGTGAGATHRASRPDDTPTALASTASPSGFREYPVPTAGGYPAQIALDGQGRVWVSERDGNCIARFDPVTETWHEIDVPTPGSQPWGLAVDAKGDVWFAEPGANQIARLDVNAGILREYTVPTPGSEPWDVAVGDDGTIWFTERAADQIGKLVTSTGHIVEIPVPTAGAAPTGIGTYDRYVWFVESAASRLGRLDAATGHFNEIPRPAGSAPQDVALTQAGTVWFTEAGADRIVLFNPSTLGWFLEVDLPRPDSEPYGIALEGNVAVWFTERAGNRLGRFSGSIPPFEVPLPTPGSLPTDIAVDGAGCAWYAAPGSNRIGRLCLPLHDLYLPAVMRSRP
jgi:streptogramin lyase